MADFVPDERVERVGEAEREVAGRVGRGGRERPVDDGGIEETIVHHHDASVEGRRARAGRELVAPAPADGEDVGHLCVAVVRRVGVVVEQADVDRGDADSRAPERRGCVGRVAVVDQGRELGPVGVDVPPVHVADLSAGRVGVVQEREVECRAPGVVELGAEGHRRRRQEDVVGRPLVPSPDDGVGVGVGGGSALAEDVRCGLGRASVEDAPRHGDVEHVGRAGEIARPLAAVGDGERDGGRDGERRGECGHGDGRGAEVTMVHGEPLSGTEAPGRHTTPGRNPSPVGRPSCERRPQQPLTGACKRVPPVALRAFTIPPGATPVKRFL